MSLGAPATGSHRTYADRASFDVAEITVSLWVYWRAAANSNRVIQRGVLGAAGEFGYGVTSGGAHFFGVHVGGGVRVASVAGLPGRNRWMHIIGSYQQADGAIRFFIDGVQVASTAYSAASMTAGTTDIRLLETTAGTGHSDATVAHLGVFGVLLTAEERALLGYGVPPHLIRSGSREQVIADSLKLGSINLADMTTPTDTGALVWTPNFEPFPARRDALQLAPGDRRPKRVVRGRASAGAPASPLLLRLHNERLFTGGFA